MGIQLHYRIDDLEAAALASGSEFTRSTTSFVYHDYDEHGLEVAVFDKRYSVSIDGQYIGTTDEHFETAWFDNKNANMDLRDILDKMGIPHSRS